MAVLPEIHQSCGLISPGSGNGELKHVVQLDMYLTNPNYMYADRILCHHYIKRVQCNYLTDRTPNC